MDGNLSMNSHFENLPEEAMKEQQSEISPIDGLNKEEFEKIREQIIEYIKMYRTDGEPIGAYKIMKLFEPFLKIQEVKGFADMMKASFRAGKRSFAIDLKDLQSVLHNVQNVMAGYSQDDTWSDYDKKSHAELIEMQYIVEAEILNVQPGNDMLCGVGKK